MIYTAKAKKFAIYLNSYPYKTIAQVKAETGADIVFNGTWYDNSPVKPVGNFTVDGVVLSNEYVKCLGYGWDNGELPTMAWYAANEKDNFICATPLIHNGSKLTLNYPTEIGGARGRTAQGQKANGEWVFLCTSDSNGAMTMEHLQAKMFDLGCVSAMSYDGGGSSQMITPDGTVMTSRTIYNYPCVWLDGGENAPEETTESATTYIHGIDVSEHQGVIDWGKAENEIDFAMIRAGVGTRLDYQFIRNITECNRIGIPCGVYWFSYADNETEAADEAARCTEAIKPYKVEYPVCFDFEYASATNIQSKGVTPTKALCSAICHAFCAATEAAGYYTMVYTNDGFISQYYDSTIAAKYDLWVPTYPNTTPTTFDSPPRSCGIWQYTSTGSVAGIDGNVDLDVSYKDYTSIITAAGLNNLTAETVSEETETIIDTAEERAAQKLIQAGYGDILIALAEKI